jgi:adenylate kinase
MTDIPVASPQKPATVLFFGSQGAGKGTQVKLLMEYLQSKSDRKIIHIDMGQLLRDAVAAGGHTGKIIDYYLTNGMLVPDFFAIYLQTKKLVENLTDGEEHIIADGLGRTAEQARDIDNTMLFYDRHDVHVVDLRVSEEIAVERLIKRGRSDDTPDAIRNRLAWYRSDVLPQLEVFRDRGHKVHSIDGEPEEKIIHQNILKALGLDV